ncbi:MAG: response regulator, partial [Myxococcota bacterium]
MSPRPSDDENARFRTPPPVDGAGAEVLLVDRDASVRDGLRELLARIGFSVTAIADPLAATTLAAEKFFAVCLVDLDTPEPGRGAEVVRALVKASPTSAIFGLAARSAFALGVEAFRAGALDVVLKSPEGAGYLRRRVAEAARGVGRAVDRDRLLVEMKELHEQLLERLMQTARRAADLEDRMSVSQSIPQSESLCRVLYVDDEGDALAALEAALGKRAGFALVGAPSGGAALDYVAGERYHVVLVKEGLPDLPGEMVARSLRDLSPESVVVLFRPPAGGAGVFHILERTGESVSRPLAAQFAGPDDMAARIVELREAQSARTRERRYLRTFREQNLDLLRKHADAKRRIEEALAAPKDEA